MSGGGRFWTRVALTAFALGAAGGAMMYVLLGGW